MPNNSSEETPTANLVGTSFVKMFRDYLISLTIEDKDITDKEIIKRALLERNIKPKTTRKYLKELRYLDIIK